MKSVQFFLAAVASSALVSGAVLDARTKATCAATDTCVNGTTTTGINGYQYTAFCGAKTHFPPLRFRYGRYKATTSEACTAACADEIDCCAVNFELSKCTCHAILSLDGLCLEDEITDFVTKPVAGWDTAHYTAVDLPV